MSDDGLVQIYASADTTDGLLMQGRLEIEGIPVMLKGESEGPYRMGPTYLWVPAERQADARAIVEAVRAGAFALDEDADGIVFDEERAQEEAEGAAPR
jgi:hypothetical protein